MINRVILTGRLTDNPQIRNTTTKLASFTIAVGRRFHQQNQPQADFIRCVAFGKLAELIEQYVTKGMMIGVEGRIQTGSYDDATTGKKVYTTDVVCDNVQFLESKKSANDANSQAYNFSSEPSVQSENFSINVESSDSQEYENLGLASDDLPF